ncbi:MAG: RloB family protein [Proteobacteria bacterium]|nr:RloB family protein [Pseudomonadota bacterium]
MGTDNLFHKRKAKRFNRRKPFRPEYEKVLIVCEGGKTEPNYFNELIAHFEINTANVTVKGNCGSSPKCVYQHAENLDENEVDPYDRVYCVIDKDTHESYEDTRIKIENKQNFYLANSVPCFEYWILLHFKQTTRPYSAKSNSSIANEVFKDLKKYIPSYKKGDNKIFQATLAKLELAIKNAEHSINQSIQNQTDNPSTNVHKLVEYLINIKQT